MIVCLCLAVSDRTIEAVLAKGASSVEAVGAACGAGTECGSCQPALQRMIEDAGMAVAACAQ